MGAINGILMGVYAVVIVKNWVLPKVLVRNWVLPEGDSQKLSLTRRW